jgi:hypothetical protein
MMTIAQLQQELSDAGRAVAVIQLLMIFYSNK